MQPSRDEQRQNKQRRNQVIGFRIEIECNVFVIRCIQMKKQLLFLIFFFCFYVLNVHAGGPYGNCAGYVNYPSCDGDCDCIHNIAIGYPPAYGFVGIRLDYIDVGNFGRRIKRCDYCSDEECSSTFEVGDYYDCAPAECPDGTQMNEHGLCIEESCEPPGPAPWPPSAFVWDSEICEWVLIDCSAEGPGYSTDGWFEYGSQQCKNGCVYNWAYGTSDGRSWWKQSDFQCSGQEEATPINTEDECQPGEILLPNGFCVPECPEGMKLEGGICVRDCPPGTEPHGNECLYPCPDGYRREGRLCVPEESCGPGFHPHPLTGECVQTEEPWEPWEPAEEDEEPSPPLAPPQDPGPVVGGGSPSCPLGYFYDGSACIPANPPTPDPDCPEGWFQVGDLCVSTQIPPNPCPVGYVAVGDECIPEGGDAELPAMPQITAPEIKFPKTEVKTWAEIYAMYRAGFDTSPLGAALQDVEFSIPASSCPSITFHNPWGENFTIFSHCMVWESLSPIISILSYFAYTYIAFRMFVR